MALDNHLRTLAKEMAQDYVLKSLITAIDQLHPNSGLGEGLKDMVNNSVPRMNIGGNLDQQVQDEIRATVLSDALEIIESGISPNIAADI